MGSPRWRVSIMRWLGTAIWSQLAYLALAFGRPRAPAVAPDTSIIEVHDRGSDVTIVAFAGLAALHGGMVNFEFTNLMQKHGITANLVFVRDPRCSCYHLAPDGGRDGLAFYEKSVRSVLEKLGSQYHVALGTSTGGMAAALFGHRLGMHQVIAFSPTWPPRRYLIEGGWLAHLRVLGRLVLKPAAFVERLVLSRMARFCEQVLDTTLGPGGMVDLEGELSTSTGHTEMIVYYGRDCEPDAATAHAIARLPGAEAVALPTAMHNTTAYLRARSDLVSLIRERIRQTMGSRGVLRSGPQRKLSKDEVSVLLAGVTS